MVLERRNSLLGFLEGLVLRPRKIERVFLLLGEDVDASRRWRIHKGITSKPCRPFGVFRASIFRWALRKLRCGQPCCRGRVLNAL